MQGKGIIKFFLVVLVLVSLLQYLYMLPTGKVEKRAEVYAEQQSLLAPESEREAVSKEARVRYLDSMSSEEIFSIPLIKNYTYSELKASQLNLGLDLKGGYSAVLQVDLRNFVRQLSGNSKDPTFNQALDAAQAKLASAQSDYVTLFGSEWNAIAGDKRLSTIFARSLREEVNYETSDGEIIRLIREKANQTVDLTFKRLKDRIDKFGVTQPNVSLDAARDLILVELPGVDNPERARTYLQASAKLEFWDVYRVTDPGVFESFVEADRLLTSLSEGDTTVQDEEEFTIERRMEPVYDDSTGAVIDSTEIIDTIPVSVDPLANKGPLLSKLSLNGAAGQLGFPPAVMGVADRNQMRVIDNMLSNERVRSLFPQDMSFRWSYEPRKDFETGRKMDDYMLYAVKLVRGSEDPPLDGEHVTRASSQPDPTTGEVKISLSMDQQGARIWGNMTTKAAQDNNREIAITLDDQVVSAPRVNQAILSGESSIEGDFSIKEGQDLSNILEIGKLPAEVNIAQEALVGPYLGKANIEKSFKSLVIGLLLVLVFMVLYYATGGIVSIIALLANLFFIFGALASFGTVLTLPGMAGIVLTIGMAVDANVIIFERIREELREGKSTLSAIKDGFNHSYSAIIDANVTTILVAMVLAYFGLGPIKGFAVVLIIGVISSLFTAVLLGRLIIDWWVGSGRNIAFWSPMSKNWFAHMEIDWLGKRKIAYVISSAVILLGIASFAMRGFELGVDFKGGYSYNIQFDDGVNVDADGLRQDLTTTFGDEPVVKSVDTRNTYNVTTSYLIDSEEEDAADQVMETLFNGVNAMAGGNLDFEEFKDPGSESTHVISSAKVGPTIADDIKTSSAYAGIFALLLIFLYIFIRFNKWQYSLGAVAALVHDSLIVLAIFSIGYGRLPFSMEIDQAFIAAILTVIGYSINDTVVVFDRIREYLNTYLTKSKTEVINMAVNSTVSRTVITSLTTLFVVLVLFIFGGGSIKGFAFALVVGIVVGTYSSIFVATPIMTDLSGELKPKKASSKSTFAKSKVKA